MKEIQAINKKVKELRMDKVDKKMDLANLICSNDKGLSYPNMTECERYGMTWGCDADCPVFQKKKECELQKENEIRFGGILSEKTNTNNKT